MASVYHVWRGHSEKKQESSISDALNFVTSKDRIRKKTSVMDERRGENKASFSSDLIANDLINTSGATNGR